MINGTRQAAYFIVAITVTVIFLGALGSDGNWNEKYCF